MIIKLKYIWKCMQYFIHQYLSFIHSKTRSTKIVKQLTWHGIMSWQSGISTTPQLVYILFLKIFWWSTLVNGQCCTLTKLVDTSNSFEMPSHPRGIFLNKYYCVVERSWGRHVIKNQLVRKCLFYPNVV